MPSFADSIANSAISINNGFNQQIQGQANRIAQLQGGGAGALQGVPGADTVQQAFSGGGGANPAQLMKAAVQAILQNPELMQLLPKAAQEKLKQQFPQLAQAAKGGCCGCAGG